jgi:protein gp37
MAENSKIEWTDHTFNPWMGCTKVSPACKHCYAERDMDHRYGKVAWGPVGNRVVTSDENWKKPVRWNREAGERGIRYRVFCASLADVFEDWRGLILNSRLFSLNNKGEEAGNSDFHNDDLLTMQHLRERLFALIDATPNLDWLLLTKRPDNITRMWPKKFCDNHVCEAAGGSGVLCPHDSCDVEDGIRLAHRKNVWLGTSVESSDYLPRIDALKAAGGLASVLFISAEPLLGAIPTLGEYLDGINWVIAGGESGPEARPSSPNWFRSVRDQCAMHGVPFHFKQWGEWLSVSHGGSNGAMHEWGDGEVSINVGKKYAGRLLDGELHDGSPLLSKV